MALKVLCLLIFSRPSQRYPFSRLFIRNIINKRLFLSLLSATVIIIISSFLKYNIRAISYSINTTSIPTQIPTPSAKTNFYYMIFLYPLSIVIIIMILIFWHHNDMIFSIYTVKIYSVFSWNRSAVGMWKIHTCWQLLPGVIFSFGFDNCCWRDEDHISEYFVGGLFEELLCLFIQCFWGCCMSYPCSSLELCTWSLGGSCG